MARSEVIVVRDNTAQLQAAIAELTDTELLVGVPSTKAGRRDGPASNAVIAYVQDNGLPERNIPARPFLRPGIENAMNEITTRLRDAARLAMDGSLEACRRALHAVGLTAQASVRAKITDGPFTPLAESTLAQRRARGRTGTRPLIDTGQLRNSITYVLRNRRNNDNGGTS